MSISYTYDTLVAAIQNFAEDDDPDFLQEIPDFISKAETRILRELDLELFEDWLEVTISGSNRQVAKPSDVIEINEVFIRDPSAQKWMVVPRRKFEYCTMYAPHEATAGVPRYFSEFNETDIYVVPTPDQSYAGGNARALCTIRPTGLSSSNQTTWLGTNLADLLFQACMVEAQIYLKNQAKMEMAATAYMSLMPGIEKEMRDVKRPEYKMLNMKQGADA